MHLCIATAIGAACVAALAAAAPLAAAAAPAPGDTAARFGTLPVIAAPALAPDGRSVAYIHAGRALETDVVVIDLARGRQTPIARLDGDPLRFEWCDWAESDRLACSAAGSRRMRGRTYPVQRLLAMGADGSKLIKLGETNTGEELRTRGCDGDVIDWLDGTPDRILMARSFIPEFSTGTHLARQGDGLGVVQVDTLTLATRIVEAPDPGAAGFLSDGHGNVRIKTLQHYDSQGYAKPIDYHYYRVDHDTAWREFGENDAEGNGRVPVAVDAATDSAYVLQRRGLRTTLDRVKLDGSMRIDVVAARPDTDVLDAVTLGRRGGVIGASFDTDPPQVEYFDPAYQLLAKSLARALPPSFEINIVDASADGRKVLVFAGNDSDPGRYYLLDRTTHHLDQLLSTRPNLKNIELGRTRRITFPAADGTELNGHLTLPVGVSAAKKMPAIVIPVGDPASRDAFGFDWLGQFFANRGFVVLRPELRDAYHDNAFRNWRAASGDVCDAARWLIESGRADPTMLATFGWGSGGYLALASAELQPDLFTAVIAVDPITDLPRWTSHHRRMAAFIGDDADIVTAGSPARHADRLRAQVLLFHGEGDWYVRVDQSMQMKRALQRAGNRSTLVTYPDVDEQMLNGTRRADLLRRSDAFLRKSLHLSADSRPRR